MTTSGFKLIQELVGEKVMEEKKLVLCEQFANCIREDQL